MVSWGWRLLTGYPLAFQPVPPKEQHVHFSINISTSTNCWEKHSWTRVYSLNDIRTTLPRKWNSLLAFCAGWRPVVPLFQEKSLLLVSFWLDWFCWYHLQVCFTVHLVQTRPPASLSPDVTHFSFRTHYWFNTACGVVISLWGGTIYKVILGKFPSFSCCKTVIISGHINGFSSKFLLSDQSRAKQARSTLFCGPGMICRLSVNLRLRCL